MIYFIEIEFTLAIKQPYFLILKMKTKATQKKHTFNTVGLQEKLKLIASIFAPL